MKPNDPDGGTTAATGRPRRPRNGAHPDGAQRAGAIPREARSFQGLRAGIVSRLLAGIVDFGLVVSALVAGYLGVAGLRFLWQPITFRFSSPSFPVLFLAGFTILVSYLTVSWWLVGRTYGDHLLGLRVINARGRRMTLVAAWVRAMLCALVPLGLLWVAVSRQDRSLQDIVLRTSVIYDWDAGTRSTGSP